jgi:hypothetical protein
MHPSRILTIGDVAAHFGVEPWQVRRLYQRGLLPPATRVGVYRVAFESDLPTIEGALVRAGYIPRQEVCDAAS